MTVKTALVTVLAWGVAFACLGAATGATIGTLAPDYYKTVFRNGESLSIDPLEVGIGLGATQGLASGVAVSIVVLALLAWRDVGAARPTMGTEGPTDIRLTRSWRVHALWAVVTTMSVIVVGAVAFILGGINGQQQLYQSWTDQKLDKLATILEPGDFNGVEADYSSAAQVYLTGTIKDSATRDTLRNQLVITFGTEEANEMIWRVDVAQ